MLLYREQRGRKPECSVSTRKNQYVIDLNYAHWHQANYGTTGSLRLCTKQHCVTVIYDVIVFPLKLEVCRLQVLFAGNYIYGLR